MDGLGTAMPVEIVVQVTEEDIRKGKQRSKHGCPVALACLRAFRTERAKTPDFIAVAFLVPPAVNAWIMRYDIDGPSAVSPITFALSVPAPPHTPVAVYCGTRDDPIERSNDDRLA